MTQEELQTVRTTTNHLKYLDEIQYEPLRELTEKVLLEYSDSYKIGRSYLVIDLMMAMLKHKNQVDTNSRAAWIELLVAAGYMYNLFYDGTVSSLFKAREIISEKMIEYKIPVNGIAVIFSAIEGQFGDQTPVEKCRPNGVSPEELFSWAVFVVDIYHGQYKLPNGSSYKREE